MGVRKTALRRGVETTALAVAYYGAARLGLMLQLPGTNASAVWPPSGIALAGMLVLGPHVWPGIAGAAFLANLLTLPHTGSGFIASIAIAGGNTLEQIAVLLMVRRVCPSLNPFERPRDAMWFVGVCVASCFIGATNGVSVLRALGIINPAVYRSAWLTWWVGDLAGMIVLGPALHAWSRKPPAGLATAKLVEAAAILAATVLGAALIFGGRTVPSFVASRPNLLIIVLMWTAFRFGQRETSTIAVLISALAVGQTWNVVAAARAGAASEVSFGPFVNLATTPNDWLLALQVYLCMTAVVAVVLASAVAERDLSARALKESEQRFRTFFEQAAVGVALLETETGRFCRVNERYCDIVGLPEAELTRTSFQAITHPADLEADLENMKRLVKGEIGQFTLEKRYCRADGSTVWVNMTVSPTWKPGDRADYHIAIIEDITTRRHAETALRGMNQALEARVGERTAQLEAANHELQLQMRERERVEARLRSSLQEKETLLREIHHRVKNNLAVVSGLLYLESTQLHDEQTVRVLQESQHRVRSMAMVHEKLYRSGDLAAVNFREYLESLLDYLLQCYASTSSRVCVHTDIDELLLDADTAVPCGLIFTELVTNSLKHAFPSDRTGAIAVRLHKGVNGHHVLSVADDGVGIADDASVDNAPTLGWRLVRSLTRQLDGTFAISGAPGVQAVLQFPTKEVHPA